MSQWIGAAAAGAIAVLVAVLSFRWFRREKSLSDQAADLAGQHAKDAKRRADLEVAAATSRAKEALEARTDSVEAEVEVEAARSSLADVWNACSRDGEE